MVKLRYERYQRPGLRYTIVDDNVKLPAQGFYFHYDMQIAPYPELTPTEIYDKSPLVLNTLYYRWRILGLYFGYNPCCIQWFISYAAYPEKFPKIDGPWIGTGFLPCLCCAKRVSKRVRHQLTDTNWQQYFFHHRVDKGVFPRAEHSYGDFHVLRKQAVSHWIQVQPFWGRIAKISLAAMGRPTLPLCTK